MNRALEDSVVELVSSFDGTVLAARRLGRGDDIPVLIVNAVGANLALWRPLLGRLEPPRRAVTWDHRGLLQSGPPASARVDPGAHAEDAVSVLETFGMERAVVVAWSNGGRIAIELAHRYPERVACLALVCAGYGHSPGRLLRRVDLSSLLALGAGVGKHFSASLGAVFRGVVARPELAGLIRQSGLVGPTADVSTLVEVLHGMADSDFRALMTVYDAVTGDAAPALLTGIQAPTLLVAGGRDRFTSLAMVREMERALPRCRLKVYDDATHYLPIEFPERLAADLGGLFASSGR